MQRAMLIHQGEHALYQLVAAFVLKLPQVDASDVSFLKCVTSGATQRALARDFNRERWPSAAQDALPCLNDFTCLHWFSFWPEIKQRSHRRGWLPLLHKNRGKRLPGRCGDSLLRYKKGTNKA